MKSSRCAVGLLGLAIVGLWYFVGGTHPLPASRAADAPPRVTAPLTHENLTVYFVHGPDAVADAKVMSLQEALDRELAVVHETSNVNVLAIENKSSEYELFVQSGDIVKGGKQDRMVQTDMLLPPRSGLVPLPAHCVEQGRWTGRGTEDAKKFLSSYQCAAGRELKYANYAGQQAAVWDNVKRNQDKLNENLKANVNDKASPTSFQLTLEQAALVAKIGQYEAALRAAGEDRDNVIGVVFAVNGHISGAEVYGSNALFRKAWPKLLNAAAVEAVLDGTGGSIAAAPSAREIERFLAYDATAEPTGPADQTLSNGDERNVADNNEINRARASGNNDVVQTGGRAGQTRGSGSTTVQAGGLARPTPEPAPNADNNRQMFRFSAGVFGSNGGGRAAAQPMGQPVNNDGNRLNSNRTENRSTLVVESTDAGRAGAVIHRSYLPAPAAQPAPARPAAQPAPVQPAPAIPPAPRP